MMVHLRPVISEDLAPKNVVGKMVSSCQIFDTQKEVSDGLPVRYKVSITSSSNFCAIFVPKRLPTTNRNIFVLIPVATQPVVCTMHRMKTKHWAERYPERYCHWTHNVDEIAGHRLVSKTNESVRNCFALMQVVVIALPTVRPPKVQRVEMDRFVSQFRSSRSSKLTNFFYFFNSIVLMDDVLLNMKTLFLTIHNILLAMQARMLTIHKLSK